MDNHGIELTRFLIMLSDALELASPGMARHQTKTAFIALRIAEVLGFTRSRKRDLVYAALLHDIGALSPEEKVELHSPNPDLIARHCQNGGAVLSRVPLLERVGSLVAAHHAAWTEAGGAGGDEAFDANIIHLADSAEVAIDRGRYILFQHEGLRKELALSRGAEFAPEIADAFHEVSATEEFWLELASPSLPSDFVEDGGLVNYHCSMAEFASISTLVRDIIDFRSTFTATHSSGVAAAASALGRLLGFSDDGCLALEIAGNLHDIGKMAIPNSILLKPAPLSPEEGALMRQHPWLTGRVLSRAGLPSDIVEWASWHHERLDGSGYPRRAGASAIALGSRILSVVDVFTALAEERPYRPALERDAILHLMEKEVALGSLAPGIAGLVLDNYDHVETAMRAAQEAAAAFYGARLSASPPARGGL
jgi:putative nucleotidyltransferase with HDIG domain